MAIRTDDYCIEHGADFMDCDKVWGAIPYCRKCREELTKPAPKPHYTEVTTKYGEKFKIRSNGPAEAIEAIRSDLRDILDC